MNKLYLQLFADTVNHVNVTTDTRNTSSVPYDPTGANTLSAEMKTYYDKNLIREAQAQLIHDQFAQKRPIPRNGGKKIEFRKFSPLPKALTPLTEGVTPVGKRLDVTAFEAEVAQYGDYITQSDVLELTAIDNTILEATKLLGTQAGLTLDTITRNKLDEGSNVSYCPKVGADGAETAVTSRANLDTTCQLTVKMVEKTVAKLKGQNAPTIDGKYVCLAHPYVIYSLRRDPEWIEAHKYARPENLYTNEVGEIAGVRFVESTERTVVRNTSHAVFLSIFLGQNAYGVTEIEGGGLQTIVKQKGSAGTADPLDQRSSVGWKAIKTAEILIQPYIVRVESCVADFDTTPAN